MFLDRNHLFDTGHPKCAETSPTTFPVLDKITFEALTTSTARSAAITSSIWDAGT